MLSPSFEIAPLHSLIRLTDGRFYLWLEWFQEHVLDRVPILRSTHRYAAESGQILPTPISAS